MQAVILVGGLGTRLREVVNDRPKPMALVNGKPFLEYLINNLKKNNINDIILATGYMSDFIENYFGNGEKFGVNIVYSKEDKPLGTGGAIKNTERYIKENNIFIVNGDTYFDLDYNSMYKFHSKNNSFFTIALKKELSTLRYGAVEFNSKNIVTSFVEKGKIANSTFINGGVYLVSKDILSFISSSEKISMEQDVIPQIMKTKNIFGFKNDSYFIDIGIPDDYLKFCKDTEEERE